MASKSKKRRRVFRASCILAALIIAGSSFAWFTSSDEVTNRLSANADYGVKIVESFAPPMNWLPGQKINKDVYATNTGNIGAFVKEEVSGVMTVTTEKNTPSKTDNSLELKPEERYAIESGAFLAYKPNGSTNQLGNIVVARPDDDADGTTTDFVPTTEGLYVFRRVINVNTADATETFTSNGTYAALDADRTTKVGYEGYYFVPASGGEPAKYYKISELTVKQDNVADIANDHVSTDGNLLYASAGFVEREKKVLDPMELTYKVLTNDDVTTGAYKDKGVEAGKYLIASYDTGNSNNATELKVLADAYDKAIHEFEYAQALKNAAAAELATATNGDGTPGTGSTAANARFSTANDALTQATSNLADALEDVNEKKIDKDNKNAKYAETKRKFEASELKCFGQAGGNDSAGNYTNDSLCGLKVAADQKVTSLTNANANNNDQTFLNELKAYNNTWNFASINDINLSVAQLETFRDAMLAGTPDEAHTYYAAVADQLIATRNYNDEKSNYDTLKAANTSAKADSDAADAAYTNGTDGALEVYTQAVADYEAAVAEYEAAYEAKVAANQVTAEKQKKSDEASTAFTKAQAQLSAAQSAYETKRDAADSLDSDGTLDIFIKLNDAKVIADTTAPSSNDQWLLKPNPVVNDRADFYYTGILEGGETTTKLIDSVTLGADATQDMYKSFDFDLNIAMKSAQITYKDNDTISADATPTELGQFATLATPTDIDTVVSWSDTQP